MALLDSCIFCKIIQGYIPAKKIFETAHSFVFLDINPLSKGHTLVIPKFHAQFMHQVPDEHLADILACCKRIASVLCPEGNYNILQNNGRIAHQAVDHVHFHVIPKTASNGLGIDWSAQHNLDEATASKLEAQLKQSIEAQK